jgi:hypothetical protein
VAASAKSIYLLSFVGKVPDRHYPLTAIPPHQTGHVVDFTRDKSTVCIRYQVLLAAYCKAANANKRFFYISVALFLFLDSRLVPPPLILPTDCIFGFHMILKIDGINHFFFVTMFFAEVIDFLNI